MINVTVENFQQEVIEASLQVPVLVDFWAPWCGPCQTLGPMLEKLETEFQGRWKLVKINSDDNPELSQAFRIRSIPYVVAMVGGKPVDQFMGVQPEAQLRAFLQRLVPNPSQIEHAKAQALLDQGDEASALDALKNALALDTANDAARLDLMEVLLNREETDSAESQWGLLSKKTLADPQLKPHLDAIQSRLQALKQSVQLPSSPELEQRVAHNPNDLAARLDLAQLYIAHKAWEAALEQLLQIVERDRSFNDDIGRKTMIQVFDMAANNAPLVSHYRRALSSAILK
jgi:putative thioredoxin